MSRFVFSVLFSLAAAVSCPAQVLFTEDFSSPVSDPVEFVTNCPASLNYGYQKEAGGSLQIKNYDKGVCYKLPAEITSPTEYKTQYFSFLLQSENPDNSNRFAGVIFYKDGKEVLGLGNDSKSNHFSYWESDGQGRAIGDIKTIIDNAVCKIVLRIDYNDNGPEKIKIGLNPINRRSEARQPEHIWSEHTMELAFDEIRIRCGRDNCVWNFDELIFAADFASVMNTDNDPGDLIGQLDKNNVALNNGNMVAPACARFLPATMTTDQMEPSLALVKPLNDISAVNSGWQIQPQYSQYNGRKYAYLKLDPETDLYGTGEVMGSLLRNGYKVVYKNFDNPLYGKTDRMYQTHPWVIGVRPDGSAFGVLFDSTWISELDLREGIVFSVSDQAPFFPVYIFEGDSPQDITEQLGSVTGTMPMPPRWALGYQQCRWSYYPDARAREIADNFRAKQIPCDVIWFDIHYMDEYRIFTFDKNRYPDPKATNSYLHSLGFKSVWMIDPGVKYEPGYSVYDSGTANDAWVKNASGEPFIGGVWPGDCTFPDFTSPDVRKWWAGLYKDYMANGIDGVWNDMNEPSVFGGPEGTMPDDNLHRGGGDLLPGTHKKYHNTFGMLMTKASRAGILAANPDKRPFVLTRSNFIGGHRYAATWTGDNNATWEHLKYSVPMSITLGLSGQPLNGPDIGGFGGNATKDLWGHWVALGAYYPFSRAHTSLGTANQEPWEFGPEVETAARTALDRRYRLMPYLYTAFYNSHQTGLPVMNPVMFADPADVNIRMEDRAFMVGTDLIIVPQWADDVKLPSGIWQNISITDDTDKYQCDTILRGGSILPLGPVVQSTAMIDTIQSLTLVIVLDKDGKASGNLYEDAGDGYEFENGQFCKSTFTAQKQGDKVIVRCTGQTGDLAVKSRMANIKIVTPDNTFTSYGNLLAPEGVKVIVK